MDEHQPNNLISRNPKTTYITATTTGLVALCNFIPDELYKKVFITLSPAVTLASAWFFKKASNYFYNMIQYKRGVKAYRTIITDLNNKLTNQVLSKAEINKIKKIIERHEQDLHELEIKNIHVFI